MRRKVLWFALLSVLLAAANLMRWKVWAQDPAAQAAYAAEPGGTPEENLWQVLVLMGAGDSEPAVWDGTLRIAGGELYEVEGYRFEPPDRLLPQGGWRLRTKVETVLEHSSLGRAKGAPQPRRLIPKGLLLRGAGTASTWVSLETAQGPCGFSPMRLGFGAAEKCAGGRIEVRRIPPVTDLSGTSLRQHDFPSIAAGADGALWITWSSYHDRQEELNLRRWCDGRWTRLIPVGGPAADLWRPQVAADDAGTPWLLWSEQRRGNWDIYAMPWEGAAWGRERRLSEGASPDIEPSVARGPDGAVYVVWQVLAGRHSQIRLRFLKSGQWSETVAVTSAPFDDWQPSVAAGEDGVVWIAWDRYTTSYDIYCRSFTRASEKKGSDRSARAPRRTGIQQVSSAGQTGLTSFSHSPAGGALGPEMKVAATARFEAYASVAVDAQGRPWIAFETGEVNWGKDSGVALGDRAPGGPLGGPRRIEVLCLDGSQWRAAAEVAFTDSLGVGSTGESDPLLHFDPDGNLWMAFKRRYSRMAFRPSIYWEAYLTRLDGGRWTEPIPLPRSWTRKSARMSLASSGGRLWAFWPSESRNYAFASRPLANRVIAGSIRLPGAGNAPVLGDYAPQTPPAPKGHADESGDLKAIRGHRARIGGVEMRIVRGDLHRHTELSQDVGGLDDGTLPEFYRYMLNAAEMDFGASTDHQAGGTDYWNFITQKMTDMFHFPGRYISFFAYERNLANPHGHRNIVHTRRDYPIVPFFQRIDPRFMLPDSPDGELLTFNSASFGGGIENDTKLLYQELRKSGGLAIPHTTGTSSMGTDWRDNDPKLDPVVEIYQGARQNYEHKNAPRGVRDGEEKRADGGFQAPGMVWNAWKKGYRIGVIASSDHYSTHISYAMVYTPAMTRPAIFDAIRQRPRVRGHRQHHPGVLAGRPLHGRGFRRAVAAADPGQGARHGRDRRHPPDPRRRLHPQVRAGQAGGGFGIHGQRRRPRPALVLCPGRAAQRRAGVVEPDLGEVRAFSTQQSAFSSGPAVSAHFPGCLLMADR